MDQIPLDAFRHDFHSYIESKLFNDRVVVISGEISEYTAETLTPLIYAMSDVSEPITIFITSYGGAVDAGGAIIRAIRAAQLKGVQVIGEVRGYAMSMAAVILQACDLRFAAPEDIVMVHGATGSSIGDIRNQEADVKLTKALMDIHARFFAERNTSEDAQYHDVAYWRKLLDDNFPHYYFGHEAHRLGLIDDVLLPEGAQGERGDGP